MFKYSAFQYNCQCMVKDVLESNELYISDSFINLGAGYKECLQIRDIDSERGHKYISVYHQIDQCQ